MSFGQLPSYPDGSHKPYGIYVVQTVVKKPTATAMARNKLSLTTYYPTCTQCKIGGTVVECQQIGRFICLSCGLILKEKILSQAPETRSFADDAQDVKNDKCRVGFGGDQVFQQCGLSTAINGPGFENIQRHMKKSNPRSVGNIAARIHRFSSMIGIQSKFTRSMAGLIFTKSAPLLSVRMNIDIHVLSCLYLSMKQSPTELQSRPSDLGELMEYDTGKNESKLKRCIKQIMWLNRSNHWFPVHNQ